METNLRRASMLVACMLLGILNSQLNANAQEMVMATDGAAVQPQSVYPQPAAARPYIRLNNPMQGFPQANYPANYQASYQPGYQPGYQPSYQPGNPVSYEQPASPVSNSDCGECSSSSSSGSASSCSSCQNGCDDFSWNHGCNCPRNFFTIEASYMNLGLPRQRPLVLDQNTLQPVLQTGDAPFHGEFAPKFTFGSILENGFTFEGIYFGMLDFDASANTRGGDNNLRLPGDIGLALRDFFGADFMRVDYKMGFNNAELNMWKRYQCTGWSVMGGFRYIDFHESFNIHAIDSNAFESDYNVGTENNLYGGQLGAKFEQCFCGLELQLFGKAGIYDNFTHQNTRLADDNNTFPIRNSETGGTAVSFVYEAGINGTAHFNKFLSLRGGYNVMWIDRLARAPDQLDFTDTPGSGTDLVRNGTAFLHGASIGLEANW